MDTLLLVLGLAFVVGMGSALDLPFSAGAAVALLMFVGYHSITLLEPRWGVGKVMADITVVSVRNNGRITHAQAIARSVIRLLEGVFGFALLGWTGEQAWLLLPVGVELMLVVLTPWRQSVADFLAGTLVIRQPAPRPHPAPAAPMFSANDAEFGWPPRKRR